MNIILVHEAAFAFEGVRAVHFSVIRSENYDCVAEHSVLSEAVNNLHQVIIVVLYAVQVIILIVFPDVGAGDFSGKNAPVVIVELDSFGEVFCGEVKAVCCRHRQIVSPAVNFAVRFSA